MSDPLGSNKERQSFLRRWSRRKARVRQGNLLSGQGAPGSGWEGGANSAEGLSAGSPSADLEPLPEPEGVGEDSDVSIFLASGVDEECQRRALRRLFQSPKFNRVDDLDVYNGDYRSFETLGEVITAHLRHRMQFEAEKAARQVTQVGSDPDCEAPSSEPSNPTPFGESGTQGKPSY